MIWDFLSTWKHICLIFWIIKHISCSKLPQYHQWNSGQLSNTDRVEEKRFVFGLFRSSAQPSLQCRCDADYCRSLNPILQHQLLSSSQNQHKGWVPKKKPEKLCPFHKPPGDEVDDDGDNGHLPNPSRWWMASQELPWNVDTWMIQRCLHLPTQLIVGLGMELKMRPVLVFLRPIYACPCPFCLLVGMFANAGFDTSENVYIENWLKLGLRRQMGRKIANIVDMFSL